jgi:hypothetical protein
MKTIRSCRPNVHARPFADWVKAFQDSDLFSPVIAINSLLLLNGSSMYEASPMKNGRGDDQGCQGTAKKEDHNDSILLFIL